MIIVTSFLCYVRRPELVLDTSLFLEQSILALIVGEVGHASWEDQTWFRSERSPFLAGIDIYSYTNESH